MGANSQFDGHSLTVTADVITARDLGLPELPTLSYPSITGALLGGSDPGAESLIGELLGLTSTPQTAAATVLGSATSTPSMPSIPSTPSTLSALRVPSFTTSFISAASSSPSYPAMTQPAKLSPDTTTSTPPTSSSQAALDTGANAKTHIPAAVEHLLIAAGSIAATLAVVFIVFLVYRIRCGYSFQGLFPPKRQRRIPPELQRTTSHRRVTSWNSFLLNAVDAKDDDQIGEPQQANELPTVPRKAVLRPDRSPSNYALAAPPQLPERIASANASGNALQDVAEESVDESHDSALAHKSQESRKSQKSQKSPPSLQRSSLVLPIENADDNFFDETESSRQSIPTYLRRTDSSSTRHKVSHFSWTNSQAPKTPNETRFSIATSTSSVPRYRTIDSWVGAQTGRIDPARFQEHLRREGRASVESIPDVPSMPLKSPTKTSKSSKSSKSSKPSKHSQHRPDMSEPSIFRVHPGTRVDIPRASTVPSEVLDQRMNFHAF